MELIMESRSKHGRYKKSSNHPLLFKYVPNFLTINFYLGITTFLASEVYIRGHFGHFCFYCGQFDPYTINFSQLSQILTPNRLILLTLYVGLHVSQSVDAAADKYDDMAYLLTWHHKNNFSIMPHHHICQLPRVHFGWRVI